VPEEVPLEVGARRRSLSFHPWYPQVGQPSYRATQPARRLGSLTVVIELLGGFVLPAQLGRFSTATIYVATADIYVVGHRARRTRPQPKRIPYDEQDCDGVAGL
jgi:hypothetical protein